MSTIIPSKDFSEPPPSYPEPCHSGSRSSLYEKSLGGSTYFDSSSRIDSSASTLTAFPKPERIANDSFNKIYFPDIEEEWSVVERSSFVTEIFAYP